MIDIVKYKICRIDRSIVSVNIKQTDIQSILNIGDIVVNDAVGYTLKDIRNPIKFIEDNILNYDKHKTIYELVDLSDRFSGYYPNEVENLKKTGDIKCFLRNIMKDLFPQEDIHKSPNILRAGIITIKKEQYAQKKINILKGLGYTINYETIDLKGVEKGILIDIEVQNKLNIKLNKEFNHDLEYYNKNGISFTEDNILAKNL